MKNTIKYRYGVGQWVKTKVLTDRKAQNLFMEVKEVVTTANGNLYTCESPDGRRESLKEAASTEAGIFFDYVIEGDTSGDETPPEFVPIEYEFQPGENVEITDEKYGMTSAEEAKLKPADKVAKFVGVIDQVKHTVAGNLYRASWVRDPDERQRRAKWLEESEVNIVGRSEVAKRGRGRPRKDAVTV